MRRKVSSRRFVPAFASLEYRNVPSTFDPITPTVGGSTPPPIAGPGPLPVVPVPVDLKKILNPYQPSPVPAPVYIAV